MKTIKNRLLVLTIFLATLLLTACIKIIKGEGNVVKQEVCNETFNKIGLSINCTINYHQTEERPHVEIEIDDDLLPFLDIHVEKGVLVVKKKKEYRNMHFKATKCVINAYSNDLREIDIAGGSNFNIVTPFSTDELEISLAGSVSVNFLHNIDINELEIEASGSSKVTANEGCIKRCSLSLAGNNCTELDKVISEVMDISIAGSGKAMVSVSKELKYDIAGSGEILYKGTPSISGDISGSGKISAVE